jgi:hypothetical protein
MEAPGMAIRVIYKDKNIGIVHESRLDGLIKSGRIAAYCRPDEEWVSIRHYPSVSGVYSEGPEKDKSEAADTCNSL